MKCVAAGEPQPSPAAIEWTVSPWRENPAGAALAVLAAALLWLLTKWSLAGESFLSTLLGLAVLGALAPGMAPIQCRVDADGAARRVLFAWDRRRWSDVRRARLGARGLFVSPLPRPHRLDRFRGLFLPFPRRDPAAGRLEEELRREIGRHGL